MSTSTTTSRVWDLPLRLFHWGLAAAAVAAFVTGDEPTRGRAHVLLGTLAASLVVFRGIWGFAGERWSRWSAFASSGPGHTRSAAVSAATALALVVGLGVSGVVVLGGEEGRGALAGLVSPATAVVVHEVHRVLAWAGVAWLGVHLAGVARQSWKERQNLVLGMVHGHKRWAGPPVERRIAVAALLVGAAPLVLLIPEDEPAAAPPDASWSTECGDCHLAFPPALLPARSWAAMLADPDHFGEALGLDEATTAALLTTAREGAADARATEHAVRIDATVPADAAPQRITTLAWWEGVHGEVPFGDTPRIGCADCHPDAERGTFDGRDARPEPRRRP